MIRSIRAVEVMVGLVADRVFGDPVSARHPVAVAGRLAARLEDVIYRPTRSSGVLHTAVTVTGAAMVGALAGTTSSVATASGWRSLRSSALVIADHLDAGDLDAARAHLPWLVGRDVEDLDHAAVARAVVESVAENATDAVVATALWGFVGGGAGAAAHRMVNTLDAMVGHHTERYEQFGWAAARLDDVMGWLPSRVCLAAVMAARPTAMARVLSVVARDGQRHPSPNSGVTEAAWAAALDVRLGGPVVYDDVLDDRPWLGDGTTEVDTRHIREAVRLLDDVVAAVLVGLALCALTP